MQVLTCTSLNYWISETEGNLKDNESYTHHVVKHLLLATVVKKESLDESLVWFSVDVFILSRVYIHIYIWRYIYAYRFIYSKDSSTVLTVSCMSRLQFGIKCDTLWCKISLNHLRDILDLTKDGVFARIRINFMSTEPIRIK